MKFNSPSCLTCASRGESLFGHCSHEEMTEVNESKACNIYKKGHFVFRENTNPVGLYCINAGSVKISRFYSDGKEQISRICRPGDFIGYRSLITGEKYTASAIAMEDTTICLIPADEFKQMVTENKRFSEEITKLVCREVEEMEQRAADMAYKPVRGRMAEVLLLLTTFSNDIQITLTREDLASLAGTVKETAIRVISEFKEDGLVEIDKRTIKVVDKQGLFKICHLYD